MIGKLPEEEQIMRPWVNSTVFQFIDSIAICIAQGYMLARARLASHPSPVVRLAAVRDNAAWDARLLKRELAVFRQERQRPRPKHRSHYTLYAGASTGDSPDHALARLVCCPDGKTIRPASEHRKWLGEAVAIGRSIESSIHRSRVEPSSRRGALDGS